MSDSPIPVLPPKEALAFFRGKGLAKSFAWQDIFTAQHDYWFTVAKMMSVSLLEEVHALIGDAMEEGISPQQLAKDLKAKLQQRGWWGRKIEIDPLTSEQKVVQLGSDRRVRTIVNTNLRTSYSAGRYARQDRVRDAFPILVYKSRMDGKERPEHHAWHDTALPIGDDWWRTHYPPCDWGCRCRTVSMTAKQAERRALDVGARPATAGKRRWTNKRTGEVMEIERGIGAGWDYHTGRAKLEGLSPDPLFGYAREGDGTSIAAAAPSALARFLGQFKLGEEGGVWLDATGWPLPVTPRWLMGLSAQRQDVAAAAARAIAAPDEIRLVWVTGKDGRAMLVRRYLGGGFVVDIGNAMWRFGTASPGRVAELRTGVQAWPMPSDQASLASYDPHQARDANGRWRSSSQSAVDLASEIWGGSNRRETIRLGPIDDALRGKLRKLGVRDDAKSIAIDADAMRHVRRRHGKDSRGQKPIVPEDFRHARAIIHNGAITHGTPTKHPHRGTSLLYVRARIAGADYSAIYEVQKHRIHLFDLRKR